MLKLKRTYLLFFLLLLSVILILVFINFRRFKHSLDKIPDAAKIHKIIFSNGEGDKTITKEADIKKIMAFIDKHNVVGVMPDRGDVTGPIHYIKIIYKDIFVNDQYIGFFGDTLSLWVPYKVKVWYQLKNEVTEEELIDLYDSFKVKVDTSIHYLN